MEEAGIFERGKALQMDNNYTAKQEPCPFSCRAESYFMR